MRVLSQRAKLSWAIGEIGIAIYVGATMSFAMFYFTEAHSIAPAIAGLALLVPRIWDGVTDPIMGLISDRTRSRFGRRRPYLLVGSFLYGAAFWLFLSVPGHADPDVAIWYLVAAYMIASTAMTVYDVPFSSMAAEMTQDYRERVNLAAYKMVAARLGILIAGGLGPVLYTSTDDLLSGFALMGAVFGSIMAVSGLIAFFGTADAPRTEHSTQALNFRAEAKALLHNLPFRTLFAAFTCQNIAIGASATMLVYFLTFAMQVEATYIGPLLLTGALVGTVVTPLWAKFSRRLEKRTAYMLGLTISAIMSVPALFLPPEYFWLLMAVYALAAIGDAANQLFPASMTPDTVEADQVKSGQRREGVIFGAMAFSRKLGMAGGAFLASLILSLSGFLPGEVPFSEQPDSAIIGVRIGYGLVPFVLWVSALLFIRNYNLSESAFLKLRQRLTTGGTERS
ncbi:MAG: MFS transporter [Gammaproteobacteria bacterium]|nr:MFS transporter [Gammaproteobacteria bacterium]